MNLNSGAGYQIKRQQHKIMEFVGRKVKIELNNSSQYEGFVHSVDPVFGKLSLEKVLCTDEDGEKTKLHGLQNVFGHEIASIVATEEVIKPRCKEETNIERRKNGDRCIMKPKISNPHLERLGSLNPKSLTLKNNKADDGMTSSGNEEGSSGTEQEDIISHPDYTIIAKLNSVFYDALQHISKFLVIGVAMEGVSLGRNGKLCWVQIAVPGHVIVFDILKLGKAAFDDGLKDILEAETILKVFHDCRMVSDIMYHQYDISLVNVFDTQVASAFVYRLRHHNDWPRHVDGLASCLIDHLDLSADQVNWAVIRDGYRETDEEVWLQRPVKRNLIAALVKNVIHLLDLRQVLTDKMMEEYVAGVNIYLSQVRDASSGDTERYQRTSYLLPSAFQDVKRFMTSYHRRGQRDEVRDVNGFRENYAPIRQPNVIFSRDSLWHVGGKNTASTQKDAGKHEPKKLARYAAQASQLLLQCNDEQQTADSMSERQPQTGTRQNSEESNRTKVRNSSKRMIDLLKMNEQEHEWDDSSVLDSVPGSNIDYVSETTELMNRERDMRSHGMVTHQGYTSHTPSQHLSLSSHGVQDTLSQDSESQGTQELSVGSMMRALIHQQAPPGSEENPELDGMTLLPAGKMIPTCNKKSSPMVQQVQTTRSTDTNFARRLIEKEMEISNRSKWKSRPVSAQETFTVPYEERMSDIHAASDLQTESVAQKYEKQNFFPWQSRHEDKISHALDQSYSDIGTKSHFLIPKMPGDSGNFQASRSRQSYQSSSSEDENVIPPISKTTSPLSSRLQALMNAMKT